MDSSLNHGVREDDSSRATTAGVTWIRELGHDPDAEPDPSPMCTTIDWLRYFATNHLVEDWTYVNALLAFGTLSGDRVALPSGVWGEVILVVEAPRGQVQMFDNRRETSDADIHARGIWIHIIQEIAEYDGGLTTAPLLDVSIDSDSTGGFDECKTQADPTSASPAWYRAWPLGQLGEF